MKNIVKFIVDNDGDDLYRKAQTSMANIGTCVCLKYLSGKYYFL